jgi:hypothetical protein
MKKRKRHPERDGGDEMVTVEPGLAEGIQLALRGEFPLTKLHEALHAFDTVLVVELTALLREASFEIGGPGLSETHDVHAMHERGSIKRDVLWPDARAGRATQKPRKSVSDSLQHVLSSQVMESPRSRYDPSGTPSWRRTSVVKGQDYCTK